MHASRKHLLVTAVLGIVVAWWLSPSSIASSPGAPQKHSGRGMSAMGRAAAKARRAISADAAASPDYEKDLEEAGDCVNEPDCEGDSFDDPDAPAGPAGTQSETSIAVDSTGQHIVIAFNDFRGFSSNPLSLSGFMYSDDGGRTFVDGGQLPSPGTDLIGTTRLPQVFGDPDVKYIGGCTFIYSSIIVKKFSATQAVDTLGVHRSTDCGHTWSGPFEVTSATNPNGQLLGGAPADAADKELMDVDPETGRVLMSWSNFTPTSVEISTTYSDNITAATPTWSTRKIVSNSVLDGQASVPRFAGNLSSNVYVTWWRGFSDFSNQVMFVRSTDNGATWSVPTGLSPASFFFPDHVLGNDRIHIFPSLAVDNSNNSTRGNLYVVYAQNDSHDGSDIAFQRSTDEGLTFSAPVFINSRPGHDRSQWFPWISVDSMTGRIHVFYYDQGIRDSGDLTEVSHTYSDDGGLSWKQPLPINSRPFHAGWGNDTSQPNLGDYNQSVAQGGDFFIVYSEASRPPAGFIDGQPTSVSLTVPDVLVARLFTEDHKFKATAVDLGTVGFTESGGNGYIDPGDTVSLTLPIRNYVTNPLSAEKVRGIDAELTTSTPGVIVVDGKTNYKNLNPGATETNEKLFTLQIGPSFVVGTPIELALEVRSAEHGETTLLHTLFTGTPSPTTLINENFNGVAPGALPTGWIAAHGLGANTVPWTTRNTFCNAGSNAAFHQNANDGPSGRHARWERLISPTFVVPGNTDYVTVDMDVCYDTEDDPGFNVLAYDGFFLRVFDGTAGRLARSVLAEAFADEFTTGSFFHYPKHMPRSSNPSYFEDMSAWAGDSGGFKHVRLRLPGMAGSTSQLRFEFTQDSIAICSDVRPGHTCGVAVDNVVVRAVRSAIP